MRLYSDIYDSHKKAEGEWVEAIPAKWQEKRVKDLFRLVTQAAPASNDYELLSLYSSIGVRPRKEMEARGNKASSTDGYWIVKRGDIVVNKLLAWMGGVGFSEYDGVTSPAYDVLRKINPDIEPRYFAYLFRTEIAKKIFRKNSRGIMDMRLRLYFDKLGSLIIPLPPHYNQKLISDYLDNKTQFINQKTDILTKKISSLEKLKRSLINKVITQGLDGSVIKIDSGINWLNHTPKHWKVVRIKDLFFECKDKSSTGNEELLSVSEYTGVTKKRENMNNSEYLTRAESLIGYKLCQPGDLVINIMLAWKRGLGVSQHNGIVSPSYAVYRPLVKLDSRFFHYRLRNDDAIEEFKRNSTGIIESRLRLYSDDFYALSVAFPPLLEQIKISEYLDKKTKHIDNLIESLNKEISKLKELKIALIYDAVSGKIRVTDKRTGKRKAA